MNNKINSHYFQKALIKRVFDKQIYQYKNDRLTFKNAKNVFSSKDLFKNLSREEVLAFERDMNGLESRVMRIFTKISESENNVELSYQDSILVRQYVYMTFLRINNIHMDHSENINKIIHSDYNIRFDDHDIVGNFFFKHSFIKIIEHPKRTFLLNDSIFWTLPFDVNVDIRSIRDTVKSYPGFLFPISDNRSILFMNSFLYRDVLMSLFEEKKLKYRLNIEDPKILFLNETVCFNKSTNEEHSAIKLTPESEVDIFSSISWISEIMNRDKDQWFYRYKISEMTYNDFLLFHLDSLSKFLSVYKGLNEHSEIIFEDKTKMLELITYLLDIEKEVSYNNPADVYHWGSNNDKRLKHKIWELLNPQFLEMLFKLKKSILSLED